jgi:hypothetical protein
MDREQMLTDIARLLPEVERASEQERAARAAEEDASAAVLERLVTMLLPRFDRLADIIITRREEYSSEANRARNEFAREDFPEPGILLSEYDREEGTGTPNRLRIGGSSLYLLRDGRLLLFWRDGFREETKKRGFRPDRHEVWTTTVRQVSALDAVRHVMFIEAILETVKEALVQSVEVSEEAARESEERTARLMKLLDLIH